MRKVLTFLLLWSGSVAQAQVIDPQPMDLSAFGAEYLPVIQVASGGTSTQGAIVRETNSPFRTMKVVVHQESDLTQIDYGNSYARASVQKGDSELFSIEIHRYKSYSINWLNEDLIQIENWPDRCVELHTIFDSRNGSVIYQGGFNHCGV